MDIRAKRREYRQWMKDGMVSNVQVGEDVEVVRSTAVEI